MKKKLLALLAIFAIMIAISVTVSKFANRELRETNQDEMTIVTSFYPMYILTANLAKDVPGVHVENLTENQTGCLHDYQLTTQDMIELSSASLLVMNGGGMETFIESVIGSYPNLAIVEASEGIEMLASTAEHDHDHETEDDHEEEDHDHEMEEDHDHVHGEYNAHVWMNMEYYLMEMEKVSQALIQKDPEHRELYEKNYREYRDKVEGLKEEFEVALADTAINEVVIFHDAFAYLADEFGLEVIYTINMDDETYLSAGEVKEIIDEVNHHQVQVLFTEEQYSDSIAESIAMETEAKVYVIDSLVTGNMDLDAYLIGMRNNLDVLKDALK